MCGGNKRFATASLFSGYVLSNTFWNLIKNDYAYKARSNWDNTRFCYKLLVIIITERLESQIILISNLPLKLEKLNPEM